MWAFKHRLLSWHTCPLLQSHSFVNSDTGTDVSAVSKLVACKWQAGMPRISWLNSEGQAALSWQGLQRTAPLPALLCEQGMQTCIGCGMQGQTAAVLVFAAAQDRQATCKHVECGGQAEAAGALHTDSKQAAGMQSIRAGRALVGHLDSLQHLHADVCRAGGRRVDDQSWCWVTSELQRSVRPQRQHMWVGLGRLAWLPGHRAHACSSRGTPGLGVVPANTVCACSKPLQLQKVTWTSGWKRT